jgi:hypothetical protein
VWIFFIFGPVRFALAQLTSSPPFLLSGVASPPIDIATPLCRVALRSHGAKTSSLLPLHLPATLRPVASSRVETEALNLHHRRRPPSSDRSTPTLHSYKNVISTLVTLPTTQARLHFASSLARASHHWSSTRHRHSLLLSSHAHRLSAQRHPRWRTSRIFFTSLTAYWLNKRYTGLSTSFYS